MQRAPWPDGRGGRWCSRGRRGGPVPSRASRLVAVREGEACQPHRTGRTPSRGRAARPPLRPLLTCRAPMTSSRRRTRPMRAPSTSTMPPVVVSGAKALGARDLGSSLGATGGTGLRLRVPVRESGRREDPSFVRMTGEGVCVLGTTTPSAVSAALSVGAGASCRSAGDDASRAARPPGAARRYAPAAIRYVAGWCRSKRGSLSSCDWRLARLDAPFGAAPCSSSAERSSRMCIPSSPLPWSRS